ncbi:MAG: sugar/nucleoside kinase (ribokinase family) [Gammaproteobacteria bacterium]|jgi:sugar/nucleoside kinase (ribokinase family)
MVMTFGSSGCYYFTAEHQGEVEGFKVKSVDTTDAGDGFMAGLLQGLFKKPDTIKQLNIVEIAMPIRQCRRRNYNHRKGRHSLST